MNHYFDFERDSTPEHRTMLRYNTHLQRHQLEELLDETHTAELVDKASRELLSSDIQNEIAELHSKYGTPFAAFLTLPDINPIEPGHLETSFLECYDSSFASMRQLAEFHIEALGWQAALDEQIRAERLPPDLLHWDHHAVLEMVEGGWDIVELGGDRTTFFHQFHK